MTLLMVSIILYWLRRNRGALINAAYEREQKERVYKIRQQQRESAVSDREGWDNAWPRWQHNGHEIDMQRRQ
jgi:hypothetical protein